MTDNVVPIAFDPQQCEHDLFIRMFQRLEHEMSRARVAGASQSAILHTAFHALFSSWTRHGPPADEDHNRRLFTEELERFAEGHLDITILDNAWLDSLP